MAVFGNVMMVFNRNTDPLIPLDNFISYWKFNGNALDSVGSNNGTPTSITYPTGLIGQAADFNGTTSKVVVPDAANLSFGNGTSDVDFSTITLIKFDDLSNNPRIAIKIKADGTGYEYVVIILLSKLISSLFDSSTGGNLAPETTNTITLNQWVVLTTTYKASTKDLKVYINNDAITTDRSSGTYVAMENSTASLNIGYDPRYENVLNGQINAFALMNVTLTPEQVAYAVDRYLTANEHLIQ
jgi:hypothetical protein